MTHVRSALDGRAARTLAVAFALFAAGVVLITVARGAPAAPSSPPLMVSLEQSSSAVPLDGTMGFTGVIRFTSAASSVQARIQVERPNGRVVYLRTQYLDSAQEGTKTFAFSRVLSGLGLDPGEYPVTFSAEAVMDGSNVTTSVTAPLRVYDASEPPVKVVVVAKVHAAPMTGPDSRFELDPASTTRARDQVERISQIVLGDTLARVTLAIAPATLEEWRRIASSGYTLASGTVVPQSDPVATQYAAVLQDLQRAVATTRLELVSLGYTDPSLGDLTRYRMDGDAAVQYDAGISACFASLQATPSPSTAPAGGCVPKPMQADVAKRGVRIVIADASVTRIGRASAGAGAYPVAGSALTALVVDAAAEHGLESGDTSPTLERTFARLTTDAADQSFAVRVDLSDRVIDATTTVGAAVSALERSPWTVLARAQDIRAPKGAKAVRFEPSATRNAPAGHWTAVRTARADATGLLAVLSTSDQQAAAAQTDSLYAESSSWSDPSATWAGLNRGLAFVKATLTSARRVFAKVHVSASPVTLAGSAGDVPVTVQNNSGKTLNAVLACRTSGGVKIVGNQLIPTTLAPGETFVAVPVDMGAMLTGDLTVRVMAGSVVIAEQSVQVRRSYLDRLVYIGGIVVLLAGMLVWIVLRVRKAPDVDEFGEPVDFDADNTRERYTGADSDADTRSDAT